MPESSPGVIGQQAMAIGQLIKQYVDENPLSGAALSSRAVEYTAGRLMLLQSSTKQMNTNKVESTKFAACLFVLLIQECLRNDRKSILGFDAEFIHATMVQFVQFADAQALLEQVDLYFEREPKPRNNAKLDS